MDDRKKLVKQAISHFRYGVSHDIFSEPVTTYAKLAIEALEKANGVTVQSERMVDAVSVSELEELRDYLYAEDLIFMRGLAELNKLIANYYADGKKKRRINNGFCNTL